MNFLIDAQLPPGLAKWLIGQTHSALHVSDLMMADAPDTTIWDHALNENLVIVTKDEDFLQRHLRTVGGPIVIWLRIGNSTNRELIRWLEPRLPSVVQLLNEGSRLIEVR